jgi:hypothetical protein
MIILVAPIVAARLNVTTTLIGTICRTDQRTSGVLQSPTTTAKCGQSTQIAANHFPH